jgi:ubiquitin-protein ligase
MNLKIPFNKKVKRPSVTQKEERSQLLLKEYERVFALFREHPFINIKEVAGVPPEKYQVTYMVDGLVQSGQSIESQTEHIVEITLTGNYPIEPPVATMTRPVYHPNISADHIDLTELWAQAPALPDCITGIGEMIVYQRYRTDQPLNAEAAQWTLRNKNLLPLSKADLCYHEPKTAPGPRGNTAAIRMNDTGYFYPQSDTAKTEKIVIEPAEALVFVEPETIAPVRTPPPISVEPSIMTPVAPAPRSSRWITKVFFAVGIIAIPIIIIEMGAIFILLHKKNLEPKEAPPVAASPKAAASPVENAGSSEGKSIESAPEAQKAKNNIAPPVAQEKKAIGEAVPKVQKSMVVKKKAIHVELATPKPKEKQPTVESIEDDLKLARLYLGIGSYDDAIKRFSKVLSIDSGNREAREGLDKARKLKSRQ